MPISDVAFGQSGAGLNGSLGWFYQRNSSVRKLLSGQIPVFPTTTAPPGAITISTSTNSGNLQTYFASGSRTPATYWFTPGMLFTLPSLGFGIGSTGIIALDDDQFLTNAANPARFSGASDISTGWTGPAPFTRSYSGAAVTVLTTHGSACAVGYPCENADDVFIDGVQQLRVNGTSPASGQYAIAYGSPGTIYLGSDPTGHVIEIATVRFAISGASSTGSGTAADNVVVEGFEVKQFADTTQYGAISTTDNGKSWTIRYCYAHNNHAAGLSFTNGALVEWNRIESNGQGGIKAVNPTASTPQSIPAISGVTFRYNRLVGNKLFGPNAGYAQGWEGGGTKFGRLANSVVEANYCRDNGGATLWTDVAGYNTKYLNNVVDRGTYGSGIFDEVSYDSEIHHNLVLRCGANDNRGDTNGWPWGAGITVSTSNRSNVHHNMVVKCRQPMGAIEKYREGDVAYNRNSTHQIVLPSDASAEYHQLTGVLFEDNIVVMPNIDWGSGLVTTFVSVVIADAEPPGGTLAFTGGVKFRRNTFYVANASHFKWNFVSSTGPTWQSNNSAHVSSNTFPLDTTWLDSWLPVGLTT